MALLGKTHFEETLRFFRETPHKAQTLMKALRYLTFALAVLFTLGCASKKGGKSKPADAAREIFEADRAFARMSADRGPAAAFAQFTTGQSLQLPADGPPCGWESVDRGFHGWAP